MSYTATDFQKSILFSAGENGWRKPQMCESVLSGTGDRSGVDRACSVILKLPSPIVAALRSPGSSSIDSRNQMMFSRV